MRGYFVEGIPEALRVFCKRGAVARRFHFIENSATVFAFRVRKEVDCLACVLLEKPLRFAELYPESLGIGNLTETDG